MDVEIPARRAAALNLALEVESFLQLLVVITSEDLSRLIFIPFGIVEVCTKLGGCGEHLTME